MISKKSECEKFMKFNTNRRLNRTNLKSTIGIVIMLFLACVMVNTASAFDIPNVDPADVDIPDIDIPDDIDSIDEIQTPEIISDVPSLPLSDASRVTIEGAIFPMPDSLENEIEEYRKIAPVKQYASLLATKNRLIVVFSDEIVETGFATIDGWELINLQWDDLELGVIKANSVNIEMSGVPTTIDKIRANPDEYVLKLVKIDGTLRQISFLVDPDDDSDFVMPITAGRIVKHPTNPSNFVNLPEKISMFSDNYNRESINQIIGITDDGLSIFDFETKYWVDAEAEVNAIVLYPEIIEKFIAKTTENDVSDIVLQKGDKVLLYNIGTNIKSVETSIESLKSNPENYVGKVVTFTASDMGATVSIQEAIKEANNNKYPPADVLLHNTVAWSRPPPMLDEIQSGTLITVGASSNNQDTVISSVIGVLEVQSYTGKIVSATDVGMNLPDAIALVTYKREKVDDISVEEIGLDVKDKIDNEISAIINGLQKSDFPLTTNVASQTDDPHQTEAEERVTTVPIEAKIETALEEIPGFEAVYGIIGLLVIVNLMGRKT